LPELLGKKQNEHKFLYFEFPEKSGQIAIRMGDWKAVKSNLKKNPKAPWELYNLKTDINETTDVASTNPELLKKFDQILKREHRTSDAHIKEWEFVEEVLKEMK